MSKIVDGNGVEIKVGSRIQFAGNQSAPPDVGTVTNIKNVHEIWAAWDDENGIQAHFPAGSMNFLVIPQINKEIIVILHTNHGDVRTAYPMALKDEAIKQFESYIESGKVATMTYGVL